LVVKAVRERDVDDLKEAIEKYVKSVPETTYVELENSFRKATLDVYVMALPKKLAVTFTNMDLQGELGKKYTVTYRWSPNPSRPIERDGWPSPEENLKRLEDAGAAVKINLPLCLNCNQIGHTSKGCPQEANLIDESERPIIRCTNCEQVGHRMRDCQEARPEPKGPMSCKNCG